MSTCYTIEVTNHLPIYEEAKSHRYVRDGVLVGAGLQVHLERELVQQLEAVLLPREAGHHEVVCDPAVGRLLHLRCQPLPGFLGGRGKSDGCAPTTCW